MEQVRETLKLLRWLEAAEVDIMSWRSSERRAREPSGAEIVKVAQVIGVRHRLRVFAADRAAARSADELRAIAV